MCKGWFCHPYIIFTQIVEYGRDTTEEVILIFKDQMNMYNSHISIFYLFGNKWFNFLQIFPCKPDGISYPALAFIVHMIDYRWHMTEEGFDQVVG